MHIQSENRFEILNALSDEELCVCAGNGDRLAEELLVERYIRFVRTYARPYFLAGGDSEDLTQEGMIGLMRAIREYDAEKAASFKTFAEICIRNRLFSAVRMAAGNKHSPLNQSISLDTPFFDSNSYTGGIHHFTQCNPEDFFIDQEYAKHLLSDAQRLLSEFEAKILGYYLDGLTTKEMAEAVNRSPKSVDNAVQRVRRKIAQHLTSGDLSND